MSAWGIAIVVICGFGAFLWALAPAIRWDSLSYHIPVPLHYIANRGITEMPESYQSSFVRYAEMLYVLGLLIKPTSSIPNLIHFFMGVITTFLTFILGKKLGGTTQGILAATIFWSLPIIQKEIGSAYIDLFSAAFFLSFVYTVWIWIEQKENLWLFLSSCFAGLTLGIKISTFIPIFFVSIAIIYQILRQYRLSKTTLTKILVFGVPLLIIAIPWFVRDWIWMGNPIFPMYDQIFHSPKAIPEAPSFEFAPTAQKLSLAGIFPLTMLFESRRYYHELTGFAFGGISLFSLPVLYPWFSKPKNHRVITALFSLSLFAIALNIQISNSFRYLIAILPLLAILSSENLMLAWEWIRQQYHKPLVHIPILLLTTLYFLISQIVLISQQIAIPELMPYRYAFGEESYDQFLSRTVPSYQAYKYLDSVKSSQLKILSLGNDSRLYTTAQVFDYNSKQGWDLFHSDLASAEFSSQLEQLAYTHLLVFTPEITSKPRRYKTNVLSNEFLYKYTRIVFAQNKTLVYQLVYDGNDHRFVPPNLLTNPGFEDLSQDGVPISWELAGDPVISRDGSQSNTGRAAILITGPSITGAFQNVPVEPNHYYTVSYWAKPEDPSQVLQLLIIWLDENLQILGQSAEWVNLREGWNNYRTVFAPVQGAYYARFVITTASSGQAWVDDVCLTPASACP